jgi:circadian clock protein KaiB
VNAPDTRYSFRLFVAGSAANSARALKNLTALCERYLPERHHIEVVDALLQPALAMADGVVVTPTLIKLAPEPRCVLIGDLSNEQVVVATLRLEAT